MPLDFLAGCVIISALIEGSKIMFSEDNLEKLRALNNTIIIDEGLKDDRMSPAWGYLIQPILERIPNHFEGCIYIILNYPNLRKPLINLIGRKYPNELQRIEKLMALL
jgi:hypothetical protein